MGASESPRKRSRYGSPEPPAKRSPGRRERERSRSRERHREHSRQYEQQRDRQRDRDREGYRERDNREGGAYRDSRDRDRDRDRNLGSRDEGGSRHERSSRSYDHDRASRGHDRDRDRDRETAAEDRDISRKQQQQEPERHHHHDHHRQPQAAGDGAGRSAGAGRPAGGAGGRGRGRRGRGDGDDMAGSKQRWGKPEEWAADEAAAAPPAAPKEAPNLGLSGKLAAETNKTADGKTEMKFQPPPDARVCRQPPWKLFCFKGEEEAAPAIRLTQHPFYLFGKDRQVADIPTDHPSCSRQHAVIVFREVEVDAPDGIATLRATKPYLIDLDSINGTFINGERVEGARPYGLLHSDVIKFGLSTREYVIMNEAATAGP